MPYSKLSFGMTSNFITTVYGSDIPGVLRSLARVTRDFGGVWLTSKVIKVDGQFAAIMNVAVDTDQEEPLKAALEHEFTTLTFVYNPVISEEQLPQKVINLVVECIDRKGLTGDLSNILSNLDLEVESMDCKRFAMEGVDETVFSAKLTLAVPEEWRSEDVAGEIEALSEDVRVEVL